MNRVLWILLVIFLSLMVSVLAATVANAIKSFQKKPAGKKGRRRGHFEEPDDPFLDTTRNAPKGAAAVVFWVLAGLGCGGLSCLVGISLVIILVQSTGDPPPRVNPPNNEKPIPPVAENLGPKEKQTPMLAGAFDPTFKDQAPNGGLLIGFDVGVGQAFGVELVKAIQPWYQTPQGEVAGRKFGTDFAKVISAKARPGYAVGAINGKAGLVVNGFSVTFMRINGDRLDPNDSYSSPWIGDKTGGNGPTLLTGDGTPIVGIIGTRNVEDCTGIGLLKK